MSIFIVKDSNEKTKLQQYFYYFFMNRVITDNSIFFYLSTLIFL